MLLAGMPEEERYQSMHVVRRGGKVRSAGDAVIELWRISWRTRPKAWLALLLPPMRRKVDQEYRRLADRRAELSERVPDVPPTVARPRVLPEGDD